MTPGTAWFRLSVHNPVVQLVTAKEIAGGKPGLSPSNHQNIRFSHTALAPKPVLPLLAPPTGPFTEMSHVGVA